MTARARTAWERARKRYNNGDFPEAERCLRTALALDAGSPACWKIW